MPYPTNRPVLGGLLLAVGIAMAHASAPAATEPPPPRAVILIIGDGMDDQQITIARNYLKGAAGELLLDQMPLRAASQILTTTDEVNGKPLYVADSANTATSVKNVGAFWYFGKFSLNFGCC